MLTRLRVGRHGNVLRIRTVAAAARLPIGADPAVRSPARQAAHPAATRNPRSKPRSP
jgi:hypothetical protein